MEKVNSHSYVVGIGASAEGLRALEEFFENMPLDSGASFVVIQHLSPDFKNMMNESLERQTSMAVHLITDALPLYPNSIYLIPPGKNVVVRDGQLHLEDRDRPEGGKQPHFPIDIFFNSLARDYQTKAIAVVLSGTGSDGSQGLTVIHQEGGVVMVQDPTTAEFNGMPQSAIQTGIVDRVLAPCDLARVIYGFVRSPLDMLQAKDQDDIEITTEDTVDTYTLQRIVQLLAENSRIDFSHYKPSTLCRRIQRRCLIAGYNNLETYIQHLQQSDRERSILRAELLISVTRFFRDREAWRYLETEVIPQLFERVQPNGQLRLWVTACATGEEAYSLGMILDEVRQKLNPSVQIEIFATDVDETALERASLGRYPSSIANDISEARLQKYFILREQGYEVTRQLREMMIFSEHNLIRDAVFPRMNLISCRNVLIYLQPSLQQRVLHNLHFALVSQGKLFLGKSETLGHLAVEFNPLQRKWKIFEKIRDICLPNSTGQIPTEHSSTTPYFFASTTGRQPQFDPLLEHAFKEFAMEKRTTCLLIDRNNRVLHIVADPLKLLQLPVGRVTYDIIQLLPEPLRLPLTTALHRARQVKDTVEFARIELGKVRVHLRARLYQPGAMARDFLLVAIQAQELVLPPKTLVPVFQADDAVASHIMQLEYDLQQTRENLQATIEELETTNEEQQASNEELIASNEELQSTNEGLHSVNEELHTVNAEYQTKIEQLMKLNADLDNLLQNIQVGVIFLDSALKIRKFTTAVTQIIPLLASDIGRSLQDLTVNIDCPDLIDLIREVESQEQSIQREVKLEGEDIYFMLQIHPYRLSGDRVEGIILTCVNIDALKQTEAEIEKVNTVLEEQVAERTAALQELNKRYELVFEGSRAGLAFWDIISDCAELSPQFAAINGYNPQIKQMTSFAEYQKAVYPEDLPKLQAAITAHLEKRIPYAIEYRIRHAKGHYIWVSETGQAIWDKDDRPIFMSTSQQDITDRKQVEAALQASQAEYELVFQGSGAGMWTWNIQTGEAKISARYQQILGFSAGEEAIFSFDDFAKRVHPEDLRAVEVAIDKHLACEGVYDMEYRLQHKDGCYIWVKANGQAVWNDEGKPVFMVGSVQDISDRKAQESALKQTIAELERTTRAKDEFLANMSHELRTPLNAILGLSESMQEGIFGPTNDRQQQTLETIYESGSHLLSLINDILDSAKIGAGKIELELAPSNIHNLCQSSLRLVGQQALQQKIHLEMQLPECLPLLSLDERRIRQALLNFLSNAVKFTPEGGTVRLDARILALGEPNDATSRQHILRIGVTDTGIGISSQDRARLFQPFSQLDGKFNRRHTGTGLGLFLTRQIVELHGGMVGVSSEFGKGSCFWIDLPLEDGGQQLSKGSVADRSTFPVKIAPVKSAHPLILLVEDNPGNIITMRNYLEAKGFRLILAENGQEAIDKTQKHRPNIILMDIQMSVMDGLEATRQIRQIPELQAIPIVALTALAMEEDRQKCLQAGANDYLSKPVKLRQLVKRIQQLISRQQEI